MNHTWSLLEDQRIQTVVHEQTHVKTLLMCKPFSCLQNLSKNIHKHQTKLDEESVHSVLPSLKKYKHAHTLTTVTTPSSHTLGHDWTHIAQHIVAMFELSQYIALKLKVCRFLHNTGIGVHVCQRTAYSHHFDQGCDLFTFTEKHQTNLLGSC